MIDVLSAGRDDRGGWRLVSRTPSSADVLARAGGAFDSQSCRQSLERLRDGNGALAVLRTSDGHFTWQLNSLTGTAIAVSPPVYRDAAACRAGFTDAQRAARVALGRAGRRAGGSRPSEPSA
jgi:hypothetical protein